MAQQADRRILVPHQSDGNHHLLGDQNNRQDEPPIPDFAPPPYTPNAPPSYAGKASPTAKPRKLAKIDKMFYAFLTLIITSAIIGAAVGATRQGKKISSSTSMYHPHAIVTAVQPTSTIQPASPTTTSSAAVTTGTTAVADNDCGILPGTYLSNSGAGSGSFRTLCGIDFATGNTTSEGNATVTNIFFATTYKFEDCMDRCVAWNKNLTGPGPICAAVTYNANLTAAFAAGVAGNCALKDRRGEGFMAGDLVGSAVLEHSGEPRD
ncbi:hypothetical protein K432DRAFT_395377 [Lepidopterella palustris CBS 459.81]|uniref:Apple domain-containing protein n=1 Tax=Lepidopterella palustris CBS 459.81 TaxID=1314670 RepID=A0A8E2JCU3_9PEZI|nr:hypothetical protein K432DRAFT_395377 [Lepidopterella palustris CBS 459.81]